MTHSFWGEKSTEKATKGPEREGQAEPKLWTYESLSPHRSGLAEPRLSEQVLQDDLATVWCLELNLLSFQQSARNQETVQCSISSQQRSASRSHKVAYLEHWKMILTTSRHCSGVASISISVLTAILNLIDWYSNAVFRCKYNKYNDVYTIRLYKYLVINLT